MKYSMAAIALFIGTTASAQNLTFKSAEFNIGYRYGETGSSLPIGTWQIGVAADIGFAPDLGIEAEMAYLTNNPDSVFPYAYTGFEILLNPYWDISETVRLGAFTDTTFMAYGLSTPPTTSYGLTGRIALSDRMRLELYAGLGVARGLDFYMLGAAADYDLGNGWAVGGRADYQAFDGYAITNLGLAGSYRFATQFSPPLTVTLQYDYEMTGGTSPGMWGLKLSVPFGGEATAMRPTRNRRGMLVDRPLT